MKILVVGNGGREHALAWKLAQSPLVKKIYVAPGNAGTYREPKVENCPIDILNIEGLADFAKLKHIHFTVVGPEAPLVAGITDYFNSRNLLCLGPSQLAARLEGSKVFAKAFMERHHIPTARSCSFTKVNEAIQYLNQCQFPIVIKTDGLAAGKGVIIAHDLIHAQTTIESILSLHHFGEAGNEIIIEEFIEGEEVSFIVLSDGEHYIPLATSQDHKTRDDEDKGPNTGGMGAYSPAPFITPSLHERILKEIIEPTLEGMNKENHPYKGFLYAGLMITPQLEIKVLEYNCRFGDPETQAILMRLNSDFAELCLKALEGNLAATKIEWDPQIALTVVLAAFGYPDKYHTGDVISTLYDIPPSNQYKIFHAGTKIEESRIVTNGGRVLSITTLGTTFSEAQNKAYRLVKKVAWDGVFYRNDIGNRALKYDPN